MRYLVSGQALENSIVGALGSQAWVNQHQALEQAQLMLAHRNEDPAKYDEYDAALYQAQLLAGKQLRPAVDRYHQHFVAYCKSLKPLA